MADGSGDGVDFTKRDPESREPVSDPAGEVPFDPYRFGKPEHPIPAEYAPPGYTGPTIPTPTGYPYPSPTDNPFGNPPGTPYGNPYGAPPPTYPYGPPPPPYHGYPQPPTGNGKAVAGLVFGILSILLCVLSVLDGVLVILGLVFSIIALGESKRVPGNGRGIAVAGIVCSIIGTLLATVMTVAYVHVANKCSDLQDNRSEFQTCVRENLFKF